MPSTASRDVNLAAPCLPAGAHIIAALLLGLAWMILLVHGFMETSRLPSAGWLPRFVTFTRAAHLVGPDLQIGLMPSLLIAALGGTWIRRAWLWLLALPFVAWQFYGALVFTQTASDSLLANGLLLNVAGQAILLLVFAYLASLAAARFRR